MKNRPWPLILLAILQVLSPVWTIAFNSWALGVKPGYVLQWILERPPIEVFEVLLLMPIAGVAIYLMKRWSYVVFFVAVFWGLVSNLRYWEYASRNYSIGMIVLVYVLQIGLAIYFMIPSVRKTYLDPRVRWWEAKRRFALAIPMNLESVSDGATKRDPQAQVMNISEGGVLIRSHLALGRGTKVRTVFTVLEIEFEVDGEIMYSIAQNGSAGMYAFGIKFLHTPESKKRFQKLVHGLELIGIRDRDSEVTQPWTERFVEWASGAIRGKGWVPETNPNRPSGGSRPG